MIEQEMVFALGFLTAGLLALACLPAVWRRAIRLTTRRLRQLVPLSMDEIVAERDQLRAAFAVDQRRLEQKLEQAEAARSGLLVDLGRRDTRIAGLEGDLARAQAQAEGLSQELGATTRELFGLQAESGTAAIALNDLTGLAEKRRWQVLEAEEQARALQNTIDEGRAAIAAYETRILGLETRLADLTQDLVKARAELAHTGAAVERTVGERDAARQAAEAIAGKRDALQLELDAERAESANLKAAVEQRSATAEAADRRAADLERQLAALHIRIEELGAERTAAEAKLTAQVEAARGEARAAAVVLEELRAEKAALANALQAARQAPPLGTPAAEPRATEPAPGEGDLAALRQAITKVADDVLRMTQAGRKPDGSAPDATPAETMPAQAMNSGDRAASLLSAD